MTRDCRDRSKEPAATGRRSRQPTTNRRGAAELLRTIDQVVNSRMKTVLTLSIFLVTASAKVFEKCELAGILKNGGLDGFMGYPLKDWVCTAFYESTYNTEAVNINWNQNKALSMDCGLFQINSFWWCLDEVTPVTKRNCGMSCGDFLDDDLTNDIKCVKSIVTLHPGMKAWVAWSTRCNGQNIDKFVEGCNL